MRSLVCSSDRCRTIGGSSRVQALKSLLTLRMMRAINIPCVVKLRLRKLSARQTVLEAVTPAGLGGRLLPSGTAQGLLDGYRKIAGVK